jgi:hypothetical protein
VMSDVQLSDQGQDQGCKIQNKIQEPCKPTNTLLSEANRTRFSAT